MNTVAPAFVGPGGSAWYRTGTDHWYHGDPSCARNRIHWLTDAFFLTAAQRVRDGSTVEVVSAVDPKRRYRRLAAGAWISFAGSTQYWLSDAFVLACASQCLIEL